MKQAGFLSSGLLCLALGLGPAAAQVAPPAAPSVAPGAPQPTAPELIEDLRILSVVKPLQLSREQARRLVGVATSGHDGLATVDAEFKAKLAPARPRLLEARGTVMRGGAPSPATDEQLAYTRQTAEAVRSRSLETLIRTLTGRVREILTPAQAALIENELAAWNDQPWRRYERMFAGATGSPRRGSRMPTDPGYWLGELRDLRIDSAEGDPAHEVRDFGRKFTRNLPEGSPFAEQSAEDARSLASQVLAMPPDDFARRERELARTLARQELRLLNQQRVLEGKPVETFDPCRWFVEQVVLSPRAATDFRDLAAAKCATAPPQRVRQVSDPAPPSLL